MKVDLKSKIAREVLAYLVEHPDASDTLEGIMQWWLLEQKIRYGMAEVKRGINELVAKGLVLEYKRTESGSLYRIDQNRYEEVIRILRA